MSGPRQTFRAAVAPDHRMWTPGVWAALAVYLVWTAAWTIRLIARFERVPQPPPPIR